MELLSDVIGRHIELEKKGSGDRYFNWVEHDSFVVDNEKRLWHWYSRDEWGDLSDFYRKFGIVHPTERLKETRRVRRKPITPLDGRLYANLHRSLMSRPRILAGIRERYSLETPVVRLAGLGYSTKLDAISIPNPTNGVLLAARYRRLNEPNPKLRYFSARGSNPLFPYGLDWLSENRRLLFLVEGEMKCLSVLQMGYNCLSTAGTLFRPEWVKYLAMFQSVVHIRDRDRPGIWSASRVKRLYPSAISVVTPIYKSIDDMIVAEKQSAEAFLSSFGVRNFDVQEAIAKHRP